MGAVSIPASVACAEIEGFDSPHRLSDFLDEPVVLLDESVQVLDRAYFNKNADPAYPPHREMNVLEARVVSPPCVF